MSLISLLRAKFRGIEENIQAAADTDPDSIKGNVAQAEEELRQKKVALTQAIGRCKVAEQQYATQKAPIDRLLARAKKQRDSGDQAGALATMALIDERERAIEPLRKQVESHKAEVERFKTAVTQHADRVRAAREGANLRLTRIDSIKARQETAQVRADMEKPSSALAALERGDSRLDQMEAELEAIDEVAEITADPNDKLNGSNTESSGPDSEALAARLASL